MALLGVGIAFSFAAMANLVVENVDAGDVAVATGINTIGRTIGGAFGAAVVGAVLSGQTIAGWVVPTESAYETAFLISLGGASLALIASLLVSPAKPRDHREHAAVGAVGRG